MKMKVTVLTPAGEYSPLPPPFSLSSLCSCVFCYGFSPLFSLFSSLCFFLFSLYSSLFTPSVCFLCFLSLFFCFFSMFFFPPFSFSLLSFPVFYFFFLCFSSLFFSLLCWLFGIYRDQSSSPSAYVSPPNKHGWGSQFLLRLGCDVQSLSHRVVIIMKIKIAFLCFDRTRMLVFHNFLPFFAGGLSVFEDEDEEQHLIEVALFLDCEWPFLIWSLKFWNFAFKPLIF